jgi:hypothetical protein
VYPEPQSSSKSHRSGGKSSSKSGTDGSSPEDQDDDDDESKDRLPAILDDDEEEDEEADTDSKLAIKQEGLREASDTPSLTIDRSPSPVTETSSQPPPRPPLSRKISNQTAKQAGKSSSTNLPQDVKFYLNYFRNHMSHHHYSLKRDSGNFLKTDFLEMALRHEPLRYAVVGYAAYFHTLSKPDGRMSNFLQYYNESVSRLRASITKSRKQTLSTFCTILQLASIEVRRSPPFRDSIVECS